MKVQDCGGKDGSRGEDEGKAEARAEAKVEGGCVILNYSYYDIALLYSIVDEESEVVVFLLLYMVKARSRLSSFTIRLPMPPPLHLPHHLALSILFPYS